MCSLWYKGVGRSPSLKPRESGNIQGVDFVEESCVAKSRMLLRNSS